MHGGRLGIVALAVLLGGCAHASGVRAFLPDSGRLSYRHGCGLGERSGTYVVVRSGDKAVAFDEQSLEWAGMWVAQEFSNDLPREPSRVIVGLLRQFHAGSLVEAQGESLMDRIRSPHPVLAGPLEVGRRFAQFSVPGCEVWSEIVQVNRDVVVVETRTRSKCLEESGRGHPGERTVFRRGLGEAERLHQSEDGREWVRCYEVKRLE